MMGGYYNVLERDRIIGQVVHGEGIASYMNDGVRFQFSVKYNFGFNF